MRERRLRSLGLGNPTFLNELRKWTKVFKLVCMNLKGGNDPAKHDCLEVLVSVYALFFFVGLHQTTVHGVFTGANRLQPCYKEQRPVVVPDCYT